MADIARAASLHVVHSNELGRWDPETMREELQLMVAACQLRGEVAPFGTKADPVSYTHLTLPTIPLV